MPVVVVQQASPGTPQVPVGVEPVEEPLVAERLGVGRLGQERPEEERLVEVGKTVCDHRMAGKAAAQLAVQGLRVDMVQAPRKHWAGEKLLVADSCTWSMRVAGAVDQSGQRLPRQRRLSDVSVFEVQVVEAE